MTDISSKIVTPFATLSYPTLTDKQLARAKARGSKNPDGTESVVKFAATLVYEPGTDMAAQRASAIKGWEEKFGDTITVGNKKYTISEALDKKIIRSPFREDGEAKGYPEGSTFIGAKTETKPRILHPDMTPMTEAEVEAKMYPGAIVRASVSFFGYDKKGNKGIGVALNNMQFVRDGERLDNRVAAENEFTALDSTPTDISALIGS